MTAVSTPYLIWLAGGLHVAIILANVPLPRRLQLRRNLVGVPAFIRQIFYVHWIYIVFVLGLFAALCFAFAPELAGGSGLGRFLSAFIAGFWLLRLLLQRFYYDPQVRCANRILDSLYILALLVLVGIFGWGAFHPTA